MRKTCWTRATVIIGAFTLLAVACGSAGTASTPVASTQQPSTVTSTTPAAAAASPLEGTWQTGRVTRADAVAVLNKAGLQKWVKPFLSSGEDYRGPGYNVFTLKIQDGNWTEFVAHSGGAAEVIDVGTYVITGATVVEMPGEIRDTFRWSVDGTKLTLKFLSTSVPLPTHWTTPCPEEICERANYTAAPFERLG